MKFQFPETQESPSSKEAPSTNESTINHALQAILAALHAALRPHPQALAAAEKICIQLLGPTLPKPPDSNTNPD